MLKLSKPEMFFQKQDFYIFMKGKNRPGNGDSHENIVLNQGEAWLKPGNIYINLFMFISTRENFSRPAQVFFCWKLTLIVTRYCSHVVV